MKTKKYLERLLKSEVVLSGNVAQFAYRKVDFDIEEAVRFAETTALNVLVKLGKLAKIFQKYYEQAPEIGLVHLFRYFRRSKARQFWKRFGEEIEKIRTRKLLEAFVYGGKHVRRNNLEINEFAARDYYLSLSEENRLTLLANISKKADNSFDLFRENVNRSDLSPAEIENYRTSALFWSEVWEFLSRIKVAA